MDKRKISRRDFLKVSTITLVGTVATACGVAPTPQTIEVTKEVPVQVTVPKGVASHPS